MTWGYLGWSLVASVLALAVSSLLRYREKRRREWAYWVALGLTQVEIEALKRASRSGKRRP